MEMRDAVKLADGAVVEFNANICNVHLGREDGKTDGAEPPSPATA